MLCQRDVKFNIFQVFLYFRIYLEILYVSSEIFSGVYLITKQNFRKVKIIRLES